ncbi:hypothetical protein CPB85DRAFT_1440521 [Mucidula mucida]|nr:hypothetical protein CPB85DRAFT_1440521 [Mucidula mucida]
MTRIVSPYRTHIKELPAHETQDTSTCTFLKSCRLDAPFSVDPRSIGRGTRYFESQPRQKSLFNGTWTYINTNLPSNPCLLLDCATIPSRSSVPSPHQYIRTILTAIRTPLADFRSTHALVSHVLHAVLAHKAAYALLAEANRPEISVSNIVSAYAPDGTCTGLLTDWDLIKRVEERPYGLTGALQFRAARLCSASPPPRTIGDDIESFVLLLLWMAVRYAQNNMAPSERGDALARFEVGRSKTDMILSGTSGVVAMKLLSSDLEVVLEDVIDIFSWRYKALGFRDTHNAKAVEELRGQQVLLEGHEWLIDILSDALQNEVWANDTDGSRKAQTVERPSRVWLRGVDLF